MESLFDPSTAQNLRARIVALTPNNERQWGTMTLPQALAHCAIGLEVANGETCPPRMMIGRLIGPLIKRFALKPNEPLRHNSPTAPVFVIKGERDFATEQARLLTLFDSFVASGPTGCTTHPHTFFGPMTPDQWSALMVKHLDHHLRQFNA